MKRLSMLACAAALLLIGSSSLGGCAAVEDFGASVAVSTVSKAPIPGQDKTAFGAETTFDFLVKEAQHFVDSGFATPAQKAVIHDAVVKAQAVNKSVREAAQTGTNAGTAALVAGLNTANLDFAGALQKLGVPTG